MTQYPTHSPESKPEHDPNPDPNPYPDPGPDLKLGRCELSVLGPCPLSPSIRVTRYRIPVGVGLGCGYSWGKVELDDVGQVEINDVGQVELKVAVHVIMLRA